MGVLPLQPDKSHTTIASLMSQLRHLAAPALRRVLIYGCVGVAVSLFYTVALISCMSLLQPISPTNSSIVAFIITLPVAYVAHAKLSFADRSYDTFQPLRFALSTAATFVVSTGGMYWITEIANRSYMLGIAWTWLMIPAMNLSIYLFWVFRDARAVGRSSDREP